MKDKKVIRAMVAVGLVIVLGAGGIFVNAQIREKEAIAESKRIAESETLAERERIAKSERLAESERIAESQRLAESEALLKAEQEKEVIEKLETLVNALFSDNSKKLLSTDISQDKIKEVETLLAAMENTEFSNENAARINSLISDFSDAKNMLSVFTSLNELTIEVAITDDGTKKIEEIQKVLDELKEEKKEFIESLQATLDTLKSDVVYINNVKASVRSLFSDNTYSTVADGMTRDSYLSVVSLNDGVGVESIRLKLEEKLMVVSNYLDEKDAEAATVNNSSSGLSNTTNDNTTNSGSSSSAYSDNYSNGISTYTEPSPTTYEDTSSYVERVPTETTAAIDESVVTTPTENANPPGQSGLIPGTIIELGEPEYYGDWGGGSHYGGGGDLE